MSDTCFGARSSIALRVGRGSSSVFRLQAARGSLSFSLLTSIPYTRCVMTTASVPLIRWDGVHVVIDLQHVERLVRQWLEHAPHLRGISLTGAGDALEIKTSVVWKGATSLVLIQLAEIRLRHRHLGFRIRKVRVLGGLPLPRAVVEALLGSIKSDLVTVVRGQGIVVVDLGRWLPEEASMTIITVQATRLRMHVWLGPGHLDSLPTVRVRPQLARGEQGAVVGPEGVSVDGVIDVRSTA